MKELLLVMTAVAAGTLLAVQAGVNATLGRGIGTPVYATLASFSTGTLAIIVYCLIARAAPPQWNDVAGLPAWAWLGGTLGAVYVTAVVILAPRLGAATLTGAIICGQVTVSLVLDQFGLLGFPQQSITPGRLAGIGLLLVGLVLIRKF
jgi:transporter family-2 protein